VVCKIGPRQKLIPWTPSEKEVACPKTPVWQGDRVEVDELERLLAKHLAGGLDMHAFRRV